MQKSFFYNLFTPQQETFAEAGDGDGGGAFGTILKQFKVHFRSMLGPPMPPPKKDQPKFNFLEMGHTNFVSSIR